MIRNRPHRATAPARYHFICSRGSDTIQGKAFFVAALALFLLASASPARSGEPTGHAASAPVTKPAAAEHPTPESESLDQVSQSLQREARHPGTSRTAALVTAPLLPTALLYMHGSHWGHAPRSVARVTETEEIYIIDKWGHAWTANAYASLGRAFGRGAGGLVEPAASAYGIGVSVLFMTTMELANLSTSGVHFSIADEVAGILGAFSVLLENRPLLSRGPYSLHFGLQFGYKSYGDLTPGEPRSLALEYDNILLGPSLRLQRRELPLFSFALLNGVSNRGRAQDDYLNLRNEYYLGLKPDLFGEGVARVVGLTPGIGSVLEWGASWLNARIFYGLRVKLWDDGPYSDTPVFSD